MRRTRAPLGTASRGGAALSTSRGHHRGTKSLVFQTKPNPNRTKPDFKHSAENGAYDSTPQRVLPENVTLDKSDGRESGKKVGISAEEEEEEDIVAREATSKGIKRPAPFVVPEFVAPKKHITKLAPEVSQVFAQFRLDVERKILPSGVPCLCFGATGHRAKARIICCQQSKREFDFTRFFEYISLIDTGFIVVDESEWVEVGLVRLIRSICEMEGKNVRIGICAAGSVATKCLEAIALLPKGILACASFIFPICDFIPLKAYQLKSLIDLPVYVESECEGSQFERLIKDAGCRLETCLTHESLQDFLRRTLISAGESTSSSEISPSKTNSPRISRGLESEQSEDSCFTDYVVGPAKHSSQSQDENLAKTNDEELLNTQASETNDLLLVLDAKLTQKGRSTHVYSIHLKRNLDLLECEIVRAKPGDVLRVSMTEEYQSKDEPVYFNKLAQWTKLRLDDQTRLSVIRYCRRRGVLPRTTLPTTTTTATIAPGTANEQSTHAFYTLNDLLNGSILAKRATFRVKIVDVDSKNHAIICDDESLKTSNLRVRMMLPKPYPGAMHKVEDFSPGDYFELRNVRVEDDHCAFLDGFSIRTQIPPPPSQHHQASLSLPLNKMPISLVSIKKLRSDAHGTGLFRTEGRITEVILAGRRFSTLFHSFELPSLLVRSSPSIRKEFNTILLVLSDNDGVEVSVLVHPHKINEVLPFASAEKLLSKDPSERHKEALLCWSLLRALIHDDDKNQIELCLERHSEDGMLSLVTLDF